MEEDHRKILRKHRTVITKDLEVKKVLKRLNVLDDEDREEIKAIGTRMDQTCALLDMLPRKGSNAFKDFVSALNELKGQEHLVKLLIEDSGIEVSSISKGDVGMTTQHKEILRRNADSLHRIDLNKLVAHLSSLLDEEDKQNLLNTTKPANQRVDMLLTEVLPRRGPTAFSTFVQALEKVAPSMAKQLQQHAGIKGSSNGKISPTKQSVEETAPYSLDTPVHDILDERPELFKGFREAMDKEDVWGNGWKRFYQALGLPAGKETAFEGKEGGPTLNVINGWISREGRKATVQALLSAVSRSERGDCSYILEKSLGCKLDCVDSPIENVTYKMGSLSTEPREVKFFGDLNDSQATVVVSKLRQDALELLRIVLEEALKPDMHLSTKELILQSKTYQIRHYTNLLDDSYREQAIEALRKALPTSKGVFGPLLPPNKFIRDVGYTFRRNLTRDLSADDHWKVLAQRLGMEHTAIKYLDSRSTNPADEVLRHWEVKAHSTVGALYNILVDIGCPVIADLL